MKILLLSPASISAKNVVRDALYGCWCQGKRIARAQTPPYPLLLMGTVLGQDGHHIRVMDAYAHGIALEELMNLANNYDIAIIVSSVMTFFEDSITLEQLKVANKKLITIVTGAQPTFMPEITLESKDIDFIVRREPEFIVRDLVKALAEGDGCWVDVKGIGYKKDGKLQINDFYPLIDNLDELPFVDWRLLEHTKRYFNPIVKRLPYVVDLTTRGCYGDCIFCMSPPFYGNKIRARSAENVLEGFRRFIKDGYKEVYLRDEMFTNFPERNSIICETILKEKIDITWLCSARVGTVDKPTLRLMRRAGCHTIKFGVESGVQKLLDNIKKGITLGEIEETFRWCKEVDIRTHAHFMVGNPRENWDTLRQTIKFAKKIAPTTATFGIFTPYPGTKIYYEILKKYPQISNGFKLATKNLHTSSFFTHTICELSPEELSHAIIKMHRWFYWRPAYIASWLGRIRSLSDIKIIVKAGLSIFDFSLRGDNED